MRGDAVREFTRVLDGGQRGEGLRRHLLVELHIGLELLDHSPAESLDLGGGGGVLDHHRDLAGEPIRLIQEADDPGPAAPLDQDLHRPVGKAQQLENGGHHADLIDVRLTRVVVILVLLRGEQDLPLCRLHRFLQSPDGLLPADKERHRLVWKDDDVPEGENWKRAGFGHGHLLLSAPLQ